MPLSSLLNERAFDDETTRLLTTAFDEAWDIVRIAGGPLLATEQVGTTRRLLAQNIIVMAGEGERDLDRLIDGALERLTDSGINDSR
jgi:hypothetical protein